MTDSVTPSPNDSPSGEESDAMKAPTPHSRGDLELRRTAHEKRAR